MAFTHSGYNVNVVASAEDALEYLRKQDLDILVLDLNLPGMNGVELAEKISSEWPSIHIIAITGDLERFRQRSGDTSGFKKILIKPIQLTDLLDAVRTV